MSSPWSLRLCCGAVATVVFAAGCGGDAPPAPKRAEQPPAVANANAGGALAVKERTYIAATPWVATGTAQQILRIPTFGVVIASCSTTDRPTATLRLASTTSSSMVTVRTDDKPPVAALVRPGRELKPANAGKAALQQSWLATPWDAAEHRIVEVAVSADRSLHTNPGCSFAVKVTDVRRRR